MINIIITVCKIRFIKKLSKFFTLNFLHSNILHYILFLLLFFPYTLCIVEAKLLFFKILISPKLAVSREDMMAPLVAQEPKSA